jgi:hypothetical protein
MQFLFKLFVFQAVSFRTVVSVSGSSCGNSLFLFQEVPVGTVCYSSRQFLLEQLFLFQVVPAGTVVSLSGSSCGNSLFLFQAVPVGTVVTLPGSSF